MNRRQFTASLGAAAAAPFLPLPALARAAPSAAALNLPPAAYAWANLIARAQPSLSATKLARFLRVDAKIASSLMQQLVADGVLGAPSALGTAQALKPIEVAHKPAGLAQALQDRAEKTLKTLAKQPEPPLECDPDPALKESPDASPNEHVQTGPQTG